MLRSFAAFALVSLSAAAASADELAAPRPADDPSVSITVSPLHALVPMVELTAELRVAPRVGVAVIGGVGMFRDMDTDTRVSLYEGGASARYYVLGSFRRGLQLGAEALYVHASTDATSIDVKAAGLGLAPFVGYKWTHSSGFTLEGQIGPQVIVLRAKASSGEMAGADTVQPMANLQLGYSF